MLEEVRINGLGVIDDAVLELSAGFTVLTGETGAGKTMVVTALGLLFGGRADPARVRPGAERAAVEGRLLVAPEVAREVEESGGELDEDGTVLVLSRSVSAEGRSRAFAGGCSVPVSLLQVLADNLVAVHGQADQQQLLKPGRQRDALDRFGGAELAAVLTDYRRVFARHRAVREELEALTRAERERVAEAETLRLGLAEIEAGSSGGRRGRGAAGRGRTAVQRRRAARGGQHGPRGPGRGPGRLRRGHLGRADAARAGRASPGAGPVARPGAGRAGQQAVRGLVPAVRPGRGPRVLHRVAGLRPGPAGRGAGAAGHAGAAGPGLRRRVRRHRGRPGLGQAGRGAAGRARGRHRQAHRAGRGGGRAGHPGRVARRGSDRDAVGGGGAVRRSR